MKKKKKTNPKLNQQNKKHYHKLSVLVLAPSFFTNKFTSLQANVATEIL